MGESGRRTHTVEIPAQLRVDGPNWRSEESLGRLEAFGLPGCRCWFYSGDHGPPHFHAGVRDSWEIRVFFFQDPPHHEVKYLIKRIPRGVLRTILDLAAENRTALFAEWERSQADE